MLKKISISLIILFTTVIIFIAPKVEAADDYAEFRVTAAALGFSISDDYYPYRMLNDTFNIQERTYTIKDKLQYYTRVDDVLLKNKDANIYALIYRVLVSPHNGRDWGFMGIGSYGGEWLNHQVKVYAQLPEGCTMIQYVPKNEESSYSGTFSVGLSPSGPSISYTMSFNSSDLSIYSNSNSAADYYEAIYQFNHGSFYDLASSYVRGEVFCYGAILFTCDYSPNPQITHEIQYYDAYANSIDTLEIYGNYGIA